jgi:hypothetical protein
MGGLSHLRIKIDLLVAVIDLGNPDPGMFLAAF